MDDARPVPAERTGACPHVNSNDPRCASRFSLGRIDQAFCVCFGAYHGCPMYHRINAERAVTAVALTVSTVRQRRDARHDVATALRAIGT